MLIIVPIEEEDVPQSCTDEPCDGAVEAEVGDVLMVSAVLFGEKLSNACGKDDAKHKDHTVSTDGKITDEKKILMHKASLYIEESCFLSIIGDGRSLYN